MREGRSWYIGIFCISGSSCTGCSRHSRKAWVRAVGHFRRHWPLCSRMRTRGPRRHFWCLLARSHAGKAPGRLSSCRLLEPLTIPCLVIGSSCERIKFGGAGRGRGFLGLRILSLLRFGWSWTWRRRRRRRKWRCWCPCRFAEIIWVIGSFWRRWNSIPRNFRSGEIIFLLFCRIAQNLVGRLDGLEFGDDFYFVARIAVRMILLGCDRSAKARCDNNSTYLSYETVFLSLHGQRRPADPDRHSSLVSRLL